MRDVLRGKLLAALKKDRGMTLTEVCAAMKWQELPVEVMDELGRMVGDRQAFVIRGKSVALKENQISRLPDVWSLV